MQVQAWLVQSAAGYLANMEPVYSQVLREYRVGNPDDFLLWLIRRELWEIYCLFEHRAFLMRSEVYEEMYQRISSALPFEMQRCFTHYFKAPKLFDGAAVEVHLRRGNVVCIGYLTNLAGYNTNK